jgi:hypothetical protein
MGIFHKIEIDGQMISPIDWEMTPDISFGTFESWGGRERVRNNSECVYYFFVDNWGEEPKLCLMERAVKHARILAEIKAPPEMIRSCVEGQGRSSIFEKSYAINEQLKKWLIDHVLDGGNRHLVVPRLEVVIVEDMGPPLPEPLKGEAIPDQVSLPSQPAVINDGEIAGLVQQWNFFEAELNPTGRFVNHLAAAPSPGLVVDQRTGLMWQARGLDIGSIRMIHKKIDETNAEKYAGHADWRLPSMAEALSLLQPKKNFKELYLHPCFSSEQPFIFVAAQRKPGGYWFVDYKQGRAFWSSGTIPGGFGRLVRSLA